MSRARVRVAVVGKFQIGKSTLVNALIGENRAETGRGLSTTKANCGYRLADDVELVDTPGFDAESEDDVLALQAMQKADLVLFFREGKALDGDVYPRLIRQAAKDGKRGLFLYNCTNLERWSPYEQEELCREIEAQIDPYKDFFLGLNGRIVTPINALWALYGLGLIAEGTKEFRRIESYLRDDLEIVGEDLRFEALRLSGILPVRDELSKLPLKVLRQFAENPKSEIDLIVEAFAARFAAYCEERK